MSRSGTPPEKIQANGTHSAGGTERSSSREEKVVGGNQVLHGEIVDMPPDPDIDATPEERARIVSFSSPRPDHCLQTPIVLDRIIFREVEESEKEIRLLTKVEFH